MTTIETDPAFCAVDRCEERGRPRVCLYDGRYHHHGCIHYDGKFPEMKELGLTFRPLSDGGWRYICHNHYAILKAGRQKYAVTARARAAAS